jgi:hypothetical protein
VQEGRGGGQHRGQPAHHLRHPQQRGALLLVAAKALAILLRFVLFRGWVFRSGRVADISAGRAGYPMKLPWARYTPEPSTAGTASRNSQRAAAASHGRGTGRR